MRPHGSYLYFNLLEGKVYSLPSFPLLPLSPALHSATTTAATWPNEVLD